MIIYNFGNNYGHYIPSDNIRLELSDSTQISFSFSLYHFLTKSKKRIDNNVNDWDYFKKITNPYEFIHTPPIHSIRAVADYHAISRSFFKMIEIVQHYEILEHLASPLKSFHLAEGPGGFIEAMVYLRNNPEDSYIGMTLLEEKRNIPKWHKLKNRFKFNTSIIFEHGETGNGDLLQDTNFTKCAKLYANSMDLITGDGGFDFSVDYEKQEVFSTKLIFAQIAYALMMQKKGGSFILKIFDIFYTPTLQLIYLLNIFYSDVSICKPKTSRFANSEKYLVCRNFTKEDTSGYYESFLHIFKSLAEYPDQCIKSIFNFQIPLTFIKEVEELNCIFGKKQLNTIHSTLMMIQEQRYDKIERLRKINIDKCVQWCIKNGVPCYYQYKQHNLFTKHLNENKV
jgi:23S rRNA U2552 (ribose-2'-O)-methylase RlmE/FtsJ